jgi:hypothetical protein
LLYFAGLVAIHPRCDHRVSHLHISETPSYADEEHNIRLKVSDGTLALQGCRFVARTDFNESHIP